jgi:hypothetical protein
MPRSGIYETIYGNAGRYDSEIEHAYDLDMAEEIPIEFVNFKEFSES